MVYVPIVYQLPIAIDKPTWNRRKSKAKSNAIDELEAKFKVHSPRREARSVLNTDCESNGMNGYTDDLLSASS